MNAQFGRLLQRHRLREGLTQEELAERSGISARTIRRWETGERASPHVASVRRLAGALELDPDGRAELMSAVLGASSGAVPQQRTAAPAQLPAAVAGFTGRDSVLQQLDSLLLTRAEAMVISVLAGAPGVGKTALAVHWAHRVRHQFPDGQLHINLRGHDFLAPTHPLEAIAQFLRALGVANERIPTDLDEASGLYRTLVAGRRMVVLLDDARTADQVRPLLPGDPHCLVLITSRNRLNGLITKDGASRISVDVLTPAEACALLIRMLGEDRALADAEAVTALAEICGYLPLALRIAAAHLVNRPHHRITDYVDELRGGNRLATLHIHDDDQAALRRAFTLSYATLMPQPRRLFRLLGLVPGVDFTPEMAAALADVTVDSAAEHLDRLAEASLIHEYVARRYALHDLLRLYASECADAEESENERQDAVARLHSYYLETADAAAKRLYPAKTRLPVHPATPPMCTQSDASDWFDAERKNLAAIITAEHTWTASRLADVLRGFFWHNVDPAYWSVVANAGLAAARAVGDVPGEASAMLSLGDLNLRLARHIEAIEHYTAGLGLAEKAGWTEGQAAFQSNLAGVHWQAGQPAKAAEELLQAIPLHRNTGNIGGLANATANLGIVNRELGHLTQALELHHQALEHQCDGEAAVTRGEIGQTLFMLGRHDEALGQLEEAWDVLVRTGKRSCQSDVLRNLAAVHRARGDREQATALAENALEIALETGDPRHQANALNMLATLHNDAGAHDQAVDCHERALAIAAGYPYVDGLIGLATTHQLLGNHGQALTLANQAVDLARESQYRIAEEQALAAIRRV